MREESSQPPSKLNEQRVGCCFFKSTSGFMCSLALQVDCLFEPRPDLVPEVSRRFILLVLLSREFITS